jgi:two-component system, NarL family, nitrate/nitrite response regulator NarL
MANNLRVLIIADDPLVRAGLAGLAVREPGATVAGQSASSDDLQAAIETYRPDVVLWDLGWNPGQGLVALADIAPLAPPVLVLLPGEVHAAEAWSSGARGLLSRDIDPVRLAAGLAAVGLGLGVVEPAFMAALAPALADQGAAGREKPAPFEELTPRELDVLRLVAEGLPNKTIALRLGVSEHTVKFHVNAILGKLGVASRTEAVVRATRAGLILL